MLKSSDFIIHDLEQAYANACDHYSNNNSSAADESNIVIEQQKLQECERILVLKKWYSVRTSMEFRLFVYKRKLIAITQRDCANFYEFLKEQKVELHQKLVDFWTNNIANTFPIDNCKSCFLYL